MKFGNWLVTEESISWNGKGIQRFVIPTHDLTAQTGSQDGETDLYKWIMLATEEDWLTQDDLYDLNFAFVYAAAKSSLDFDYGIFDATLAEQFEQFDDEDEENPEWPGL